MIQFIEPLDPTLFWTSVILAITCLIIYFWFVRSAIRISNLRGIFRTRDEFFLMAIKNPKLKENYAYSQIISNLNLIIKHSKHFNLDLLIKSLETKNGFDEEKIKTFKDSLQAMDEEFKNLFEVYRSEFLTYIVVNTALATVLKLVIKFAGLAAALTLLRVGAKIAAMFNLKNIERRQQFLDKLQTI